METIKDKMKKIIERQPEDSSFEEILKELAFSFMVEKGLSDSRQGKTISNDINLLPSSSDEAFHHINSVCNGVFLILAYPTEFYEYDTNFTFMCPGRGHAIRISLEGIYYQKICGAVIEKDKFFGIANPTIVLGVKIIDY